MTTVAAARLVTDTPRDRRRYPGVRSFEEPDARRFFGRTRASDELLLRVLSVRLLLQFAPSGAGKTSLLNAGLFPRVRPHSCFPFMVRLNEPKETLVQAVERSLREAIKTGTLRDPEIPSGARDVWTFLAGTQLWSADLRRLTPLLVFDQFEEVFTLRDDAFRKEFAKQIGDVSRARRDTGEAGEAAPDVKIIISLREEYLGSLEDMSAAIPDLFRERLRVSPLSPAEAREAIIEPARLEGDYDSPKFTFDTACVDQLIDFIDGTSDRVHVIEPLTLQLVCQRAEAIATERAKTVPSPELHIADFGGAAGLEQLVHQYYTSELAKLPNEATRRKAIALFEQGLLDPAGKRLMLEEDEIRRHYGVGAPVLDSLVKSRLLRREPRNESVFYEISHDRLTEVIAKHRKTRLPRWVWLSLGAAAVVIVGLFTVMLAIGYFWYKADQANTNAANALHVLFGDDLVARLREAGLSDALAQVLDKAPSMPSDPLARAQQRRREGELAQERGTVNAAEPMFIDALEVLDGAKAGGRTDVEIDAERGQVLRDLGDLLVDKDDLAGAEARYHEAIKAWDDVVSRKDSTEYRLSNAETRTALASVADRLGRTAEAEAGYLDAAHRALPALELAYVRPPDTSSDSAFDVGRAEQVFADAALGLSRIWSMSQDLQGACALAAELLRLRPLSAQARTQYGTASAMYGSAIVTNDDWKKARVVLDQASRQFQELVQFDPRNRRMTRELAALRLLGAGTIVDCKRIDACRKALSPGEIEAAESTVSGSIGTFRELSKLDPAKLSLRDDVIWGLTTEAQFMQIRGASTSALKVVDEAVRQMDKLGAQDALSRAVRIDLQVMKAQLLMDTGQTAQSLDLIERAIQATEQLPAGSAQRMYRRWSALATRVDLLRRSGRAADASQAQKEFDALTTETDALRLARTKRSEAAEAEGSKLANQAQAANGAQQLQMLESAIKKYDEAISEDVFRRNAWIGRQVTCESVADALTPTDESATTTNHSEDARIEEAYRCAVGSAWMAWVLSDDGTGASNARDIGALESLYVARRSLAMFLHDHKHDAEAFALAEQGLREAELYARPQKESADTLFLLADANYGLGLTRERANVDGWEQAIRAAIVYGERMVTVAPSSHRQSWLGEVHIELASLLDKAQRKEAAASERAFGRQSCQEALRIATKPDERTRAQNCLDSAKN